MRLINYLLLSIFLFSAAEAAYFPLEITNIKPAGSGSPAISTDNRIFRAYPGIEYNIRAAVIGGLYPFNYSLSNAPSGMTINSATGEISWPNPQADSGTITISVTDAENTTATASWAVAVSTSGFVFLDAAYNGTETGSISQPYKTLSNLLNNVNSATAICYVRQGTYPTFEFRPYSAGNGDMLVGTDTSTPSAWIGYPGEVATFTGSSGAHFRSSGPLYIDNLHFNGFTRTTIMSGGGIGYHTVRRSVFDGIVGPAGDNTYGFIHMSSSSDTGYYMVLQNNDLKNFTGTAAIGALYDTAKALIENNYIHDNGGPGESGVDNGIGAKYRTHQLTVRGNKIVMASGYPFGRTSMSAGMENTVGQDISFNYFENSSGEWGHSFLGVSTESPFISKTNFYYYRNTLVGRLGWSNLDGESCPSGPISILNNVIINANNVFGEAEAHDFINYYTPNSPSNPWNCITDTGNLKGLPSAGIVGADGLLTSGYLANLGAVGWQLPNGSTPMDGGTKLLRRFPGGLRSIVGHLFKLPE